jgi:hypothetical protein
LCSVPHTSDLDLPWAERVEEIYAGGD